MGRMESFSLPLAAQILNPLPSNHIYFCLQKSFLFIFIEMIQDDEMEPQPQIYRVPFLYQDQGTDREELIMMTTLIAADFQFPDPV